MGICYDLLIAYMLNNYLETIADCLESKPSILAGYLYGSKAKQEEREESDLDIAIVFDRKTNTYDEFHQTSQEITDILRQAGIDGKIDIQPVFPDQNLPLFHFEVIKTNKLIYQKDTVKVVQFEMETLKKYRDYQRIKKIKYYYLDKLYRGEKNGHA